MRFSASVGVTKCCALLACLALSHSDDTPSCSHGDPTNDVCLSSTSGALQGANFKSRAVAKKVLSVEQGEGQGARVRRSIGRPELRNFDPFLMLDEFRVMPPAGFPDHPHRGFETVTYMLPTSEGVFKHEDFAGHSGTIGPGDLQWMTAGRGILHAEMPGNDKLSHGLQLWVNLAIKDKMIEPDYQELPAAQVPKVTADGVTAHVIAGEALGTKSPVYTRTPTSYLHFEMEAGSKLEQPIEPGWNAFMYTIDGTCRVGDSETEHAAHHTLALTNNGGETGVTVTAGDKGCNFVVIAGKPLNEPIQQHGPFVMSTRAEIQQAMEDFHEGKNGFERAPGWRSQIAGR